MIDPKKFYGHDDISLEKKRKIWENVKKDINYGKNKHQYFFDRKSFILGFGTAFVLLFAVIGIYTVVDQLIYRSTPANMKLNSIYLSAINQIETSLNPQRVRTGSIKVDEYIEVKKEELRQIDEAIKSFTEEYSKHDLSKIKQERLRQLYKLKLEVLEKIIEMEEYKL